MGQTSTVTPDADLRITDNAIISMKERVVDRKYDPMVWLGIGVGPRNKNFDNRG